MLFETLLEAITAIIEFIVRVILFLLKVLGLWIPLVYSILFVIFCAIFQVDFVQVLAIYFVGLAVSLIFTLYIMFLRVLARKNQRAKKREQKRAKGRERKKEREERKKAKENAVVADTVNDTTPDQPAPEPAEQVQPTPPQSQGYQPYCDPALPYRQDTSTAMESYPPLQINDTPPQYVPPADRGEPLMTCSRPVIFRTRMDPNLLIYEYSDRLVFYRKTLNGLEHIKTERKDPIR